MTHSAASRRSKPWQSLMLAAGALTALVTPLAALPAQAADTPVLSTSNLAAGAADLEFHGPGDWVTARSSATLGLTPVSPCLHGHDVEKLGAPTMVRRDYRFVPGGTGVRAGAIALEFRTSAAAQSAYQKLRSWAENCDQTLTLLGHASTEADALGSIDVVDGVATHTVVSSRTRGMSAERRRFEEIGVIHVDRRVEFITMITRGQDYSWSVDGVDLPTYPMMRSAPKAAARLALDRTRARVISDEELVARAEVPVLGDEVALTTEPGRGRNIDAISVCTLTGLRNLGAVQSRARNFSYSTASSLPVIYTAALQFATAAAARDAYLELGRRINACPQALRASDHIVITGRVRWTVAPTDAGRGKFAEIIYQKPGRGGEDAGWFESVGLTRVNDRLMITVNLVYGQDYNVSLEPEGDPETGLPAHPQFALIRSAAGRLAQ